mmetsp:Transcript_869/g.2012  ORF Transcript_869/g.2012 Transcript_869/m.2012 type:complete len:411 (-) Transcript_869:61-1293(-)
MKWASFWFAATLAAASVLSIAVFGWDFATHLQRYLIQNQIFQFEEDEICSVDGEERAPFVELFDAEVHLHNFAHVPRRGSVVSSLLQWIPHTHVRSQLIALFGFPRSLLVQLHADATPEVLVEPLEGFQYASLSHRLNVTGAMWTESTSMFAPQGQNSISTVAQVEAKWLSHQRLHQFQRSNHASSYAVAAFVGQQYIPRAMRPVHAEFLAQNRRVSSFRWTIFNDGRNRVELNGMIELARLAAVYNTVIEIVPHSHMDLEDIAEVAEMVPLATFVVTQAGAPYKCPRPLQKCRGYMRGLRAIAANNNTHLKFSRLGALSTGLGYSYKRPATVDQLTEDWQEIFRDSVKIFGPERLLFGSGYPFDGAAVSLETFWNTAKNLVYHEIPPQKHADVLANNARHLYLDRKNKH